MMVVTPPRPQNFPVYKALSHPLPRLSLLAVPRGRQGSCHLLVYRERSCSVNEFSDLPKVA